MTVARPGGQTVIKLLTGTLSRRSVADSAGVAKGDSRFGFGQLMGSAGAVLLAVSTTQQWFKLDLQEAFSAALRAKGLPANTIAEIAFTATSGKIAQVQDSPRGLALARDLGIMPTGWEQDQWVAVILLVAAAIALIGVIRSVFARTAWTARANSPLLALAGFTGLIVAAVELWLRSPAPRSAMKPDLGLWLMIGGSVCLLLGALTLGNNRRKPWMDDLDQEMPGKSFDNTEHLAYSHGAWVPRLPGNDRQR
jgi:hypothetical protein